MYIAQGAEEILCALALDVLQHHHCRIGRLAFASRVLLSMVPTLAFSDSEGCFIGCRPLLYRVPTPYLVLIAGAYLVLGADPYLVLCAEPCLV